MNRRQLTFVLLPLLACSSPVKAPAERPEAAAPSANFSWVPVRPSTQATAEEYPARLLNTHLSAAVVVPPLPARIVEILVKTGDTVEKGTPLLRVIMPEVDIAAASATAAESSLAILQKRRTQLSALETEGLVRAADLASLDLEIARHAAEKLRARATLSVAGTSQGGTSTLRSPIDGVVTELSATLGEMRRPEDGPAARVRNRSGQRIEATFPGRPAEKATYSFRTAAGLTPLLLINQIPAPSGLGYLAWFDVPVGTDMPSAAEGRVVVAAETGPGAWVVPSSAVGTRAEGRFLIARTRDSEASLVPVDLLRLTSGEATVRGALPEGSLVASDPDRARSQLSRSSP